MGRSPAKTRIIPSIKGIGLPLLMMLPPIITAIINTGKVNNFV